MEHELGEKFKHFIFEKKKKGHSVPARYSIAKKTEVC